MQSDESRMRNKQEAKSKDIRTIIEITIPQDIYNSLWQKKIFEKKPLKESIREALIKIFSTSKNKK